MKRFVKITTTLALAASTLLAAQQANALAISISDGVSTITATDSDSDGFVTLSSALGLWNFNVVTGFADPAIGTPEVYNMHLNSVNASGGTGTLTVMITDTDLTKTNASFMTGLGGLTGGSISFATYLSASNTAFSLDTLLDSAGTFNGAFSDTASGYIVTGGPYALTQVATITHGDRFNISSFDYDIKVPEPMTLALFGAGLVGMGFIGRRKRSS